MPEKYDEETSDFEDQDDGLTMYESQLEDQMINDLMDRETGEEFKKRVIDEGYEIKVNYGLIFGSLFFILFLMWIVHLIFD
ncbi:MAG: hypothetical protein KAS71_08610 [Bacteroidales bacterium]|nr:hypothetical protein [Bacteroidales bacterium]